MSIQAENYVGRAQSLENIVVENLKNAANHKVLGEFFGDVFIVSVLATGGSLFFLDKRVTLLCGGLTTALAFLVNSYLVKKCNSNIWIASVLNREVEALKKQAMTQNESHKANHVDSQRVKLIPSDSIDKASSEEHFTSP